MKNPISKQANIVSFKSLVNESDKGCALILASILEEMLRQLHEAHIATIIYPSKGKRIFESLNRSTFGHRIEIAYAYGLISKGDYEDAEILRELRNEAAHTIRDFNLNDSGVRALILNLKATTRDPASAKFLRNAFPPEMETSKRHLIYNALVLNDIIRVKLVDALEKLLQRRKAVKG